MNINIPELKTTEDGDLAITSELENWIRILSGVYSSTGRGRRQVFGGEAKELQDRQTDITDPLAFISTHLSKGRTDREVVENIFQRILGYSDIKLSPESINYVTFDSIKDEGGIKATTIEELLDVDDVQGSIEHFRAILISVELLNFFTSLYTQLSGSPADPRDEEIRQLLYSLLNEQNADLLLRKRYLNQNTVPLVGMLLPNRKLVKSLNQDRFGEPTTVFPERMLQLMQMASYGLAKETTLSELSQLDENGTREEIEKIVDYGKLLRAEQGVTSELSRHTRLFKRDIETIQNLLDDLRIAYDIIRKKDRDSGIEWLDSFVEEVYRTWFSVIKEIARGTRKKDNISRIMDVKTDIINRIRFEAFDAENICGLLMNMNKLLDIDQKSELEEVSASLLATEAQDESLESRLSQSKGRSIEDIIRIQRRKTNLNDEEIKKIRIFFSEKEEKDVSKDYLFMILELGRTTDTPWTAKEKGIISRGDEVSEGILKSMVREKVAQYEIKSLLKYCSIGISLKCDEAYSLLLQRYVGKPATEFLERVKPVLGSLSGEDFHLVNSQIKMGLVNLSFYELTNEEWDQIGEHLGFVGSKDWRKT